LGPAEVIVVRSVKQLDESTQTLFKLLGIVPEDIPCPISAVQVIWTSLHEEKRRGHRLRLHIRKMANSLLRYNICLGQLDGGIYYHDIVREVAREVIGSDHIRASQRKFIQDVLPVYAIDQRMKEYMILALPMHMMEAILPDTTTDDLAQSWLDFSDEASGSGEFIVAAVANVMGWQSLVTLAEKHEKAGELFLAAKRFLNAAKTDELVQLGKGSESGKFNSLLLRAVENLAHCEQTPQSKLMEFMSRGKLLMMIAWDDPSAPAHHHRMQELVEAGVEITSAQAMFDYGRSMMFQILHKAGFHVSGWLLYLIPHTQVKIKTTCCRCRQPFKCRITERVRCCSPTDEHDGEKSVRYD
jgi:hypothetical protein